MEPKEVDKDRDSGFETANVQQGGMESGSNHQVPIADATVTFTMFYAVR